MSFSAAALAVGAQALPAPAGAAAGFDVRGAGVPALMQLGVMAHDGRVARVRFTVKAYGEDKLALRRLLLEKHGPPLTVSPRPMSFGGFGDRGSPRGGFQWRFDDGLRASRTNARRDTTFVGVPVFRLLQVSDCAADACCGKLAARQSAGEPK